MSIVCPAGTARAPKTAVWALLTQPELYPRWMDARPVDEWDRPIRTDDVITLRVKGAPLKVTWNVIDADARQGRLRLGIHLPLGILNDETISVVARSEDETLIRFY
jgi:hypothetical protein